MSTIDPDGTSDDDAAEDKAGHAHDLQSTYRYLRLAIVLLTLLLALGVIGQVIADGVVLSSVSAYYYTGARDVFVASLCAVGTCLLIHRGRSDLEDVLLNTAGYLAFFVAFVPTAPVAQSDAQSVSIPDDVTAAVAANTWAVLAVGLVGIVLEVAAVPQRERHLDSRSAKVALGISILCYLGLASFFIFAREQFLTHAHGLAAILLFMAIVGIVGLNGVALSRERHERGLDRRRRWLNRYSYGFLIMLLTVAVILGPIRATVEQWVFILEAALILQFLSFWITQTVERWHGPTIRADSLLPG